MISKRTVIITNLRNSPIRNIVIFLSIIMFVVVLLILIGIVGIFASVFFGALGILFLAKSKIKRFLGKKPHSTLKAKSDSDFIELKKDNFKICK
ncbi:MAG: hypothetical protein FJZ16_07475 [Candidatus Omnitrophica bacterium]|nr:hypothetical protein [Candidatus Omnitrophota bacterium]